MSSTDLSSQPIEIDLETEPVLDVDLPCHACGYNLRGLKHRDNCPECGLAVTTSLEYERVFGVTRWHRSMAVGLNLLIIAQSLLWGLLIFAIAINMAAELDLIGLGYSDLDRVMRALLWLLCAPLLLAIIGLAFYTSRPRDLGRFRSDGRWGLLARLALAAAVTLGLMARLLVFVGEETDAFMGEWFGWVVVTIVVLTVAAFGLTMLLTGLHTAMVSANVLVRRYRRQALIIGWLYAAICAGLCVIYLGFALLRLLDLLENMPDVVLPILSLLAIGLSLLVLSIWLLDIWMLVLTILLRRALGRRITGVRL